MNRKNSIYEELMRSNIHKLIAIALVMCFMAVAIVCLVGCSGTNENTNEEYAPMGNASFTFIEKGKPVNTGATVSLVYDENTKIVYICTITYSTRTVLTPYYGENGRLCRYLNGEIVEINN